MKSVHPWKPNLVSMSEGGDFDERLRKAQRSRQQSNGNEGRSSAIGIAFRLSTELVVGVVVGVAIGYFLDDWLGTSPWMRIIFFFFGIAAGVVNVVRTAAQMNEANSLDSSADQTDSQKNKRR